VQNFIEENACEIEAPVKSSLLTTLMYFGGALAGIFFIYVAVWVLYGNIQITLVDALSDAAIIVLSFLCAS
jgi:hypothetical protein